MPVSVNVLAVLTANFEAVVVLIPVVLCVATFACISLPLPIVLVNVIVLVLGAVDSA